MEFPRRNRLKRLMTPAVSKDMVGVLFVLNPTKQG